MSMTVGIDTEKLNAQISKLESTKKDLESLFQNVEKDTNNLKEDWESNGSEKVYEEFNRFNLASKDYIADLGVYIDYLKNVVNQSYIDYENKENELIDENIATN